MTDAPRSTLIRGLALAGMAGMAALVSNFLAAPARRLTWGGSGPTLPGSLPQPQRPSLHTPTLPEQTGAPLPKQVRPSRPTPQEGVRMATPHHPVPLEPQGQVASNPIREIDSGEAWKAFQSGTPFLDARRSAEFTEGHIPRAWCTPVWEADVDDRLLAFKAAKRPGSEDAIVIYCGGGDCRDSHLLAARLLNDGYFHLLIYRDGYPAWVAQGHPIEKGQP